MRSELDIRGNLVNEYGNGITKTVVALRIFAGQFNRR